MILTVKNWTEFQHYKDRSPPWIRLHRELLDNFEFQCLPVASRALAPMLWLLAASSVNLKTPEIDASPQKLAFRLRMKEADVMPALKPLIDAGFFVVLQDASNALAECVQRAVPETETETETETENRSRRIASDDAPPAKPKRRDRGRDEATGTRLPADWQPNDDLKAWAVNERKDLNIEREIASFVDYWTGKAGRDGRKSDWPATFRNWIRNSRNGAPRQSFAAQQGGSRVAGRLL